jgi:class 3 adenylate cyclase
LSPYGKPNESEGFLRAAEATQRLQVMSANTEQRKHAAIMFTDMGGYSALSCP